MAPIEKVDHVLRIEHWDFDYGFGLGFIGTGEPYSDFRHLKLYSSIIQPKGIKAIRGVVTCHPTDAFAASSLLREKPRRRSGERLGGAPIEEPPKLRPVGYVSYRGDNYRARLFMPPDALPLVMQMLSAEKYHFVKFEAKKGGRDAEIHSFYFTGRLDEDEPLAAGWDDV